MMNNKINERELNIEELENVTGGILGIRSPFKKVTKPSTSWTMSKPSNIGSVKFNETLAFNRGLYNTAKSSAITGSAINSITTNNSAWNSIKYNLSTTLGKTLLVSGGLAVSGVVASTIGLGMKAGDKQEVNIEL